LDDSAGLLGALVGMQVLHHSFGYKIILGTEYEQ